MNNVRVRIDVEVKDLGFKVKAAIEEKNCDPTAIAAAAGMSVANLYRITSESTKNVPLATLAKVASALGCSLSDWLGGWINEIPGESIDE